MPHLKSVFVVFFVFCTASSAYADPVGTAFTYQGELNQSGMPASGSFDFSFELFDMPAGGSSLASAVALEDVDVVGGVLTVELVFGSAPFAGDLPWLQVGVREGADVGPQEILALRQKITPVPFALPALDWARNPVWKGLDVRRRRTPLGFLGRACAGSGQRLDQ